jgi:hypothetical protein
MTALRIESKAAPGGAGTRDDGTVRQYETNLFAAPKIRLPDCRTESKASLAS